MIAVMTFRFCLPPILLSLRGKNSMKSIYEKHDKKHCTAVSAVNFYVRGLRCTKSFFYFCSTWTSSKYLYVRRSEFFIENSARRWCLHAFIRSRDIRKQWSVSSNFIYNCGCSLFDFVACPSKALDSYIFMPCDDYYRCITRDLWTTSTCFKHTFPVNGNLAGGVYGTF